MMESIILKTNKRKDKKKEERKRNKSIVSSQLLILRTEIKPTLCLVMTKLITEEKMKYSHQSKFIIHPEESQAFNLVEGIE